VAFQRVPEPKAGKNRVHLDVRVEDLVGLGCTWDGNELTWTTRGGGPSSTQRATSSTST
jgi:hypothetical protein